MKSLIAVFAVLFGVSASFADVRLPGQNVETVTYDGARAEQKWNQINGREIAGSSSGWNGSSSSYKVERSEDGLKQTVCEKTSNWRNGTVQGYRCSFQKSTNGQPLPVFKPVIRMG